MKRQNTLKLAVIALTGCLTLIAGGCNNGQDGAVIGGILGAAGGVAIGSVTGNAGRGAVIGSVIGAGTGAVVGDQNMRNSGGGGYGNSRGY